VKLLKLTFLFTFLFTSTIVFGQDDRKKQLQIKKEKLQEEISYINTLISQNKKASNYSVSQVRNIELKISIREDLINNINSEIALIDNTISDKQSEIVKLEIELSELKKDYASLIEEAYKSKSSFNRMMFLLASNNFHQAIKRLKYMEQYTNYRKEQGEKIAEHTSMISETISKLEEEKKSKIALIDSKQEEKDKLESEKGQKQKVLNGLNRKNKQLLADIRAKQKQSDDLQKEIQAIIMEEIRLARIKANKNKKATAGSSKKFDLTAEAEALASNFKANKNKLPWPVERGLVVSKYGKHPHPTMKNITIINHGVDIATEKGSEARSVFDGEVSSIIVSKGGVKTIIIQHGNYYTVYSNLAKIYVKKGQKVSTKDKIGEVYTNIRNGDTVLKFQLWFDKNEQDPAGWVYRM